MKDLAAWRAEFPVLDTCVYLNSNSTGAVPRGVRPVLEAYWTTLASWRDEVWEGWWADLHAYADAIAAFIGAPAGSVVTDANVSTLLGRVLTALDFRERPRVVTSDLEFPSLPFLLRGFARHGVELVEVPSADGVEVDLARLVAAIDERVRLVCISHATFASGAMVDLEPILRRAREVGALVAVDAYQSVGVVDVDVTALGVDFLLGGAHKWLCGSTETAFLYVRPALLASLRPAATGWIASADPLSFRPAREYAPTARRFAAGTPAVLPALVSAVGMKILASVGPRMLREASLALTSRVIARAEDAGIEIATPREASRRAGIVTLRFAGAERVTRELGRLGFVGSHRGGLRIAPHFYNTADEVETFMDALIPLAREARDS